MTTVSYLLKPYILSEKGDSTVVLMCALSLCLVAFFAVLNSMSVIDDRKERLAIGSFVGSLGILPGGLHPEEGNKLLLKSRPILDAEDDLASQGISPEAVFDLIRSSSNHGWQKIVTIKKSNEGLAIHLSNQAFFTKGSAKLKNEGFNLLGKITELIKKSICTVLIKGHTDNIPIISSEYESNWELSAARAINVLQYFLKQGIPLSRMEAAGYGEFDPIFANVTPDYRAINRRVEILLVKKEDNEGSPSSENINIHGFLFKMRGLSGKK